jgi:hypothetical protein
MEPWIVLPLREGHRVRLLIQEDVRDPLRQRGRQYQRPLGSSPSRDVGLFRVSLKSPLRACRSRICTLLMSTKIECRELDVANGQFLRCYSRVSRCARACASQPKILRGVLTGMESRLENSDSVVLRKEAYQRVSISIQACPLMTMPCVEPRQKNPPHHTFNMCNNVVFPALSRPRNRSFACLFRSPKDARVSQTVEQTDQQSGAWSIFREESFLD